MLFASLINLHSGAGRLHLLLLLYGNKMDNSPNMPFDI